MQTFELKTPEGLIAACDYIKNNPRPELADWATKLEEFLGMVAAANADKRATLEFQTWLWNENPVANPGQGTIDVTPVIADADFRKWLSKESLQQVPDENEARIAHLTALHAEIVKRFEAKLPRVPQLKIFRVLTAFFPNDFTTVSDRKTLKILVRRMKGSATNSFVALHVYVMQRLAKVLGPVQTPTEKTWRLMLPWELYELTNPLASSEDAVSAPSSTPGQVKLIPLKAALRRRGVTAIAGGFQTALVILQEIKDGCTRDELLDYLRGSFPALKENSRKMIINVLKSEFGAIKFVDDKYVLTERGLGALESASAEDFGEWLLTRVLGVDHILKKLSSGPMSRQALLEMLKIANPGWTSDFAPNAMINWLLSMKAIQKDSAGQFILAEIGADWADLITWTPENLTPEDDDPELPLAPVAPADGKFALAELDMIESHINQGFNFPRSLIEQLHLGLWGPAKRHFAVLAGISGSGKTQLAKRYGEALVLEKVAAVQHVLIVAVQPGWYDASPLLGYLNPLQKDTYTRTAFLNFLFKAIADPSRPYVLILDEMNLSHPEQYLAPLLSAMETDKAIRLHAEDAVFDGVPETIDYPRNLAIIGTINMDETTHGLSDKVLDRAFTLEFWDIDLSTYPRWGSRSISPENEAEVRLVMEKLMECLKPTHQHFGWRVVDDILDFLAAGVTMGAQTVFQPLLDAAIYAKILPKLRGEDSPQLRETLKTTNTVLLGHGLIRSAARVKELDEELRRAGSVRFWR